MASTPNPDTLAAFDASILHQLLTPHRAYLAGLGYHLPPLAGPIDTDALATALLRADADFPADLADAFHTIVETGVDAQVGAIQAAARRANIDLGVTASQAVTPLDLAARLWLRNPDLLKRIHAEASIPTVRRYESWRCDSDEIPPFHLPDEQRVVAPWTQDLERILVEHQFGPGVRIFVCPAGRMVFFLIRHGATVQRVSVHHDDGGTGSLLFRPAVTDVIRYDPAVGELGLHLQKYTKWLSEAIRTTFSLRVFSRPHLFSGERRYTLLPIQQRGRAALDCDGFPTIEQVDLTELEIPYGDDLHYRVVHKATDVFAALEMQGVAVTRLPVPSAAKLKIILTDESTRTVSLRVPNVAVYQRDGDDDAIGAFLLDRGFILQDDDRERDQVA